MGNNQFGQISGFHFSLVISSQKNQAVSSENPVFQEVSGLSKELGLEEVSSGGENRFKFRLPKVNTFSNLVLKRGTCSSDSELIQWCMETLDNGVAEPIKPKNLNLLLLNGDGVSCR